MIAPIILFKKKKKILRVGLFSTSCIIYSSLIRLLLLKQVRAYNL
jgi:hypothetical protein